MFNSRDSTKREKFFYHNNLVALVKAVEKNYTTVDLRNECCVTGKVISVDGYMNLELSNAVFYNSRGKEYYFEHFFVQNRNILYVHMPRGTTCANLLEQQMNAVENQYRVKKKQKPTFKTKRAKTYNEQTKKEIICKSNK